MCGDDNLLLAQGHTSVKPFWDAEAAPYLATSLHSPCLVVEEEAFASY